MHPLVGVISRAAVSLVIALQGGFSALRPRMSFSMAFGDVHERLARNRRKARSCKFVEVTPHVRPAECKLNVATLGQLAIAGIAIYLQESS